jgi:hypothetical protein
LIVTVNAALGKLRSFAVGSRADQGERYYGGGVGRGCFPRDSPLDLVRSVCALRESAVTHGEPGSQGF